PRVHREHVVGGGEHEGTGVRVGEDHRLQHVHRLGDVRHDQALGVAVEAVEVDARHERVPHRVLLVQEPGVGAGFDVPPGAPLVQHQPDLLLRVVAVHDRGVAGDQLLGAGGVGEGAVPLLVAGPSGGALLLPAAGEGVVVQGDRLVRQVGTGILHEGLGPAVVVDVRAAGDPGDLVAGVLAHEGGVLTGQGRVVLGAHVPAAAPGLVADAEEGHLPRLVPTVGAAQRGHRGVVGAGEVLDPFAHLLDRAGADVAVDVG